MNVYIEVVSLLWHSILNLKIKFYKKSQNFEENLVEKTATYFSSNVLFLLVLTSFSILNFKTSTLSLEELNKHPYNILIYVYNLIGPPALGIVILLMYYLKNYNLKKYFVRHVQQFLQNGP